MIISHILLNSYISLCLYTFYKHTHTIIHTNVYTHPSANGTESPCCFLLWAFLINPFVSSHIFCSHSQISNRYPILYICCGSLSFVFNNNVIIYKLYILNFYYLFYKHRISIICNLLFYHALSCFLCGEDLKVNYRNHSLSTGINFFILWLHNNLLYKLITISPSDLYRKVFLFNPPFLIRMFL